MFNLWHERIVIFKLISIAAQIWTKNKNNVLHNLLQEFQGRKTSFNAICLFYIFMMLWITQRLLISFVFIYSNLNLLPTSISHIRFWKKVIFCIRKKCHFHIARCSFRYSLDKWQQTKLLKSTCKFFFKTRVLLFT